MPVAPATVNAPVVSKLAVVVTLSVWLPPARSCPAPFTAVPTAAVISVLSSGVPVQPVMPVNVFPPEVPV